MFNFAQGDTGYVKLGNNASGGDVVIADAVKWEYTQTGPTPTPTPTPEPTETPEPTPTPTPTPEPGEIFVNEIAMSYQVQAVFYKGVATVWIKDNSGGDVSGAEVTGEWSGSVSETTSDTTGADGKVTFISPKVKYGGTFTFCVTDVVASGYTYNPSLNNETCDSITAP
jgi:hypothetical protein